MIRRRFVEMLLLATLVPLAVVGVQSWRESGAPEPGPAPQPVNTVRPQLGRSVQGRLELSVPTAAIDDESPTEVDDRQHAPTAQETTPGIVDDVQQWIARTFTVAGFGPPSTDGRPSEDSRPRGGSGGLPGGKTTAPAAGSASGGSSASATSLALVQFIGVMNDETLLERDEFAAELVRQLKIIVLWNAAGPHVQRLELFTPQGVLYRRVTAGFTGSGVVGVRTPVETLLPVGGSWITEYSLFGAWRVDVYLDSQPTPTTTAAFVLNH